MIKGIIAYYTDKRKHKITSSLERKGLEMRHSADRGTQCTGCEADAHFKLSYSVPR